MAGEPIIRLDKTRPWSTVHGDRIPDDPHYGVTFFQQGLPFDAQGLLIKDDGKSEPWYIEVDNKRVKCFPLYNDKMRGLVEKKKTALQRKADAVPDMDDLDPDVDSERVIADASDDVNLESWLRGQAQYPAHMIFAAYKERFHKISVQLRQVVDDLVNDEKLVPEDEVSNDLMRMLNSVGTH